MREAEEEERRKQQEVKDEEERFLRLLKKVRTHHNHEPLRFVNQDEEEYVTGEGEGVKGLKVKK